MLWIHISQHSYFSCSVVCLYFMFSLSWKNKSVAQLGSEELSVCINTLIIKWIWWRLQFNTCRKKNRGSLANCLTQCTLMFFSTSLALHRSAKYTELIWCRALTNDHCHILPVVNRYFQLPKLIDCKLSAVLRDPEYLPRNHYLAGALHTGLID